MVKMRAFLFATAAVMALGFIAAPVQLDSSGLSFDTAAAAGKGGGHDDCAPVKKKGNNGWGNGGDDGTNNGSDEGTLAQSSTKSADDDR